MSLRVAAFPASVERLANPYWRLLHSALATEGVEFEDSPGAGLRMRWLWAKRGDVRAIHIHLVQQFYWYETVNARLRWVLRFGRNLVLARALGYRTIYTFHNLTPDYPLAPGWVDYLGHWFAANLTSGVIVHCDEARRLLASNFGRRHGVYVIPHPHYGNAYPNIIGRADARARLGFEGRETVFAFVGGMRRSKGIDNLLAAFARTPGEDLRLLIAGEPWPPFDYLEYLQELAGHDSRVRLLPRLIPDEEMQIYLNAADVVVLPFQSILTSSSAILAMSFGKPVIVPSRGCLSELVTDEVGFCYDPSDPDSLRRAFERCEQAPLAQMGERARQRVLSFTWEAMARQTVAAYQGMSDPFGTESVEGSCLKSAS